MSLFEGFNTDPAVAQPEKSAEVTQMELMLAVDQIINNIIPRLDDRQKWKIRCALPAPEQVETGATYGADFSLAEEINAQIQALRALRTHYMPEGKMREGVSAKEFKDFLSTTNQMIKMLTSSHEEIMNMERMRLVEAATVDALQEMGTKTAIEVFGFDPREKFLEILTKKLEKVT